MDISALMSTQDLAVTQAQVDAFNKTLDGSRTAKTTLDKDDFLKILIAQLSHQDPTQPLEDKEFIAQMAQFSSLEQITNMSQGFTRMAGLLSSSEAVSMLGQEVEIEEGGAAVTGIVDGVVRGDFPQLLVNGTYYDSDKVTKIIRRGNSL
jgi:flagellar basal-body rod modification protein FlgD